MLQFAQLTLPKYERVGVARSEKSLQHTYVVSGGKHAVRQVVDREMIISHHCTAEFSPNDNKTQTI